MPARPALLLGALLLAACSTEPPASNSAATDMAVTTEQVPPPPPPPPMPAAAPSLAMRGTADGAAFAKEDAGIGAGGAARPQQDAGTAATAAPAAGAAQAAAPAMVIRTGAASLEVRSVDSAVARVRALAARVGGYVANTSVQGGDDQLRMATLELRIPAARFDEALGGLAPIGTVEHVNVTAEEVGEEYADLEARVANARRLEARLVELLATRTGKLDDVLAVERELARVREQIERIEGRQRYLRTRVGTSSLTVAVHEPAPVVGAPGTSPIADAVRQAWRNFVGFVAAFIASLGVLVPVAVLAAAAWWGVRRLRGARRPASRPTAAGELRAEG